MIYRHDHGCMVREWLINFKKLVYFWRWLQTLIGPVIEKMLLRAIWCPLWWLMQRTQMKVQTILFQTNMMIPKMEGTFKYTMD